ncbi:hypothetical protein A4A49_59803, partial [Nicotiana attenuata]
MGKSISSSSSVSLILFLPYFFLLSVDFFGANLRANAVTALIERACNFSGVPDFCYNVLGNDPRAQMATTKFELDDILIPLAYTNYTNIVRKISAVASIETNPEYKIIYRKCLHQYNILKSDFRFLFELSRVKGNLDLDVQNASLHLFVCTEFFTQFPNIPNPFAQDNDNLTFFLELIRDISLL